MNAPENTPAITAEASGPPPCFHCGLPCSDTIPYRLEILGQRRDLCCPGCKAVAETIIDAGMESYYEHRDRGEPGSSPAPELVPGFLQQLTAWDDPAISNAYVRSNGDDSQRSDITLMVSGITCAACVWLIEHQLQRTPGMISARVNLSTHRAEVAWDNTRLKLSDVLRVISKVGYKAEPYTPHTQEDVITRENRQALARIGVAGLGTMQVMMFAVGLYAGAFQGIAIEHETFLRWVSALVCLPVYLYAGSPFIKGAWRNIKTRHPGMDLPVAIAISAAFFASLWSTYTHGPEVYFDSVCMFVFFLSVGRYTEMRARHHAIASSIRTSQQGVLMARVETDTGWILKPADRLTKGDIVSVKAGETIPGDGRIRSGITLVNEAMLTGEDEPIEKQPGDLVTGGTVNTEQPITLEIIKDPKDSVLYALRRLLDAAQSAKPGVTQLADRVAGYFVIGVLIIATVTYSSWYLLAPDQAFWITLSVLVVTCPCALSLATPAAITTATARLANQGFLPTHARFIESFHKVTDVVFDKTGTLTHGQFSIIETRPLQDIPAEELLLIAASLEQHSEHPIASAFTGRFYRRKLLPADQVRVERNRGIEAQIHGQTYRIGSPDFVGQLLTGSESPLPPLPAEAGQWILLASDAGAMAWFQVADDIRQDAGILIQYLQQQGLTCHILSGDSSDHPHRVAETLGTDQVISGASPEAKLAYIRQLQAAGKRVLMVGDGLNDAPVLAGADVSIALSTGTDLAKVAADAVLLNHQISSLGDVVAVVRRTYRIIQQNLTWALMYNTLALPAAALGFIPPWLAAIGMSSSSLIVVFNALRIKGVAANLNAIRAP
ncbi:MAG: heavy metal translocating P-type ATPase [Ketobacteraceae bacterium]|nr:heavy metal translocating P-type ATPase [Ketobacteraceae bacterium]